jgi:hypothetical protein
MPDPREVKRFMMEWAADSEDGAERREHIARRQHSQHSSELIISPRIWSRRVHTPR